MGYVLTHGLNIGYWVCAMLTPRIFGGIWITLGVCWWQFYSSRTTFLRTLRQSCALLTRTKNFSFNVWKNVEFTLSRTLIKDNFNVLVLYRTVNYFTVMMSLMDKNTQEIIALESCLAKTMRNNGRLTNPRSSIVYRTHACMYEPISLLICEVLPDAW